ncbi:MAG: 16S rRNA (guanine(527)-N(7))-methyltransferase RsmG [Burkholderiaceae bacterium]|nr:16S rRNA (guanine(527)-N(7))-methyltransferase RsmG [Burkholderiaceae bacterium]
MTRASLPRDVGALTGAVASGAAQLGIALGREQAEQLAHFAALLLKWNAVHNLTAIDRPDDVVPLHLLDSLSILPEIDSLADARALRVLDVGAGGGLPGVPLAIVRPQWRFHLIDKVQKKAAFLRQVRAELHLANVEVVHARVEAWQPAERFDAIVARAFASLADLVASTRHLLAPGGVWLAMKGAVPHEEVAALPKDARVRRTVKLRVPLLDAQRHLIILEPC